ncbi:DUF2177 family protein [Oceanicella sp. SM1341]|uniref:DUF2177 family protein n=1 Tax=Oceanicella sp. SM1341 TaxID=1548889 RepID=UPI000E4AF3E6|nr:DUF2177 family protein [Oceanicella sp. SM1341]
MAQYSIAYLVTAVVFFAIDYVWLSRIATGLYMQEIGALMRERPNLAAAAGFYLVYVVGVVYFAVAPALAEAAAAQALLRGALFGFFAYATYDMTNYATLRDWPVKIVVIDIAWGTALTGVSALAGYWGTRALGAG